MFKYEKIECAKCVKKSLELSDYRDLSLLVFMFHAAVATVFNAMALVFFTSSEIKIGAYEAN